MSDPPKPTAKATLPNGREISAYGESAEFPHELKDGSLINEVHHSIFSGNGQEHLSYDNTPDGKLVPGSTHYTPPEGKPPVSVNMDEFDPN